jgi:hypothetical protein
MAHHRDTEGTENSREDDNSFLVVFLREFSVPSVPLW